MSVIFFGVRRYGRVDDVPGAYISTTFGYLQFVPVVPRTSYVFVGSPGAPEPLAFEIPVHWRSVAAGLLRVWGPLLVVICGLSLHANEPVAIAGIAIGLAAAVWAWWLAPRVRERERLMRNVYSRWVGCPVDVAVIGSAMNATAVRMRAAMGEWAEPFVPMDYREQKKSELAYRDIALDPRMDDRRFLAAAITLCRIEEADAPLRERAKLAACRNRIFDRLATLHPEGIHEPPTVDVMWDHHVVLAAREAGVDLSPAPAPALPPEVVANRKRRDKITGVVAVAGFAAIAVAYAGWWGWAATHPKLYVWNDLPTAAITVEVDGEVVATVASASRGELRVARGSHRLRAVSQATGEALEENAVVVALSKPYFWAPATRNRLCFFIEEAHYGRDNGAPLPPPLLLDPTRTLWQLDTPLDYILENPPDSLRLDEGAHVVKRALTGVPCDASGPGSSGEE